MYLKKKMPSGCVIFVLFQKYGGFYQTKVESHLANTASLFHLIGFSEISEGLLRMHSPQSLQALLLVAFECFIASVECWIIESIWKQTLSSGICFLEIVNLRSQRVGNVADLVNWITLKYKPSNLEGALEPNVTFVAEKGKRPSFERKMDSTQVPLKGTSTDPYRKKLYEAIKSVQNIDVNDTDIPFMDDFPKQPDYTEGNFDEHLLESMRMVGEKQNKKEPKSEVTRGSKEWDFVTEGLEGQYGKKYYDGPREDILKEKSGGYVQLVAKDPNVPTPVYVNSPVDPVMDFTKERKHFIKSSPDDSLYTSVANYSQQTAEDTEPIVHAKGMNPAVTFPPGHLYNGQTDVRLTHSEPIAKRYSAPPPQAHTIPYKTPYALVQNPPSYFPPTKTDRNNIQKLLKQSSVSAVPKQQILNTEQSFPQSNSSSGFHSRSEVISNRNMPDSIVHSPVSRTLSQAHAVLAHVNDGNDLSDTNKWSCTYCTYINEKKNIVCAMCSKSRECVDTDSPPQAGHTSKVCSQCTLENEKDAELCSACGSMLQKTQTVV